MRKKVAILFLSIVFIVLMCATQHVLAKSNKEESKIETARVLVVSKFYSGGHYHFVVLYESPSGERYEYCFIYGERKITYNDGGDKVTIITDCYGNKDFQLNITPETYQSAQLIP